MRRDTMIEKLQSILRQDWDPIGVSDDKNARDEYATYTNSVIFLLRSGADAQTIGKHLEKIEREEMGLVPDLERCLKAASRLIDVYQRD